MFYCPWSLYDEFPRHKAKHMKIFINSFKRISDLFFVKYLQQIVEAFNGKQRFCTVRYQAMMYTSINSQRSNIQKIRCFSSCSLMEKAGEGREGEGTGVEGKKKENRKTNPKSIHHQQQKGKNGKKKTECVSVHLVMDHGIPKFASGLTHFVPFWKLCPFLSSGKVYSLTTEAYQSGYTWLSSAYDKDTGQSQS